MSHTERSTSSASLILFSHVMINYTNTQPDYICFNQSLCPYLAASNDMVTVDHQNSTCRAFQSFTNRTYQHAHEMIIDLKRLLCSCSLLLFEYDHHQSDCSMCRCNDGSKCLSYHRLSDGIIDCSYGEDENQLDVCSHNLSNQFTCDNGRKCFVNSLFMDGTVNIDENWIKCISLFSLTDPLR